MKTKGVLILAFWKRGYAFAAYNLALSIKKHSPDIKIALMHDNCIDQLEDKRFFDMLIPFTPNASPGEVKLSVYDSLPFDYTLMIDADSICLKDINPLFEELIKEGKYYTHIINDMYWAKPEQIKSKWGIDKFQSTNSSIQFIPKGKDVKDLFKQFVKNIKDPIPLSELKTQWGKTQPDELYQCIALAQKEIHIEPKKYIHLGSGPHPISFKEIEDSSYFLTLCGGKGFCKISYIEWYERMMHVNCRYFLKDHIYQTRFIFPDKHVNNR